ncbi:MAG: HAMP domain-containing protein, partial [Planctomycetes bacterium]|nr:HAMP domain-containing protein [Planctomycetota bacterium]
EVGTNLLTGGYRGSAAAKALKQATESRKVAMTDYAAYEPAGGAVSFFSAVPIVNGARTELVVLQRHSVAEINGIFSGLKHTNQTDEVFLVGPDYQMRSDARLDTTNRTVEASFKNPEKGRIKTAITQGVIEEGRSGTDYLTDYRGQEVLVAYTPVPFGASRWALVCKVDHDEAMAGVATIRNFMLGIGAVCALVIAAFWWLMARSFTKPVTRLAVAMGAMAKGDLRQSLPEARKDELGDLARSANTMVQGLNEALRGVLHSSDSVAHSTQEISRGNQDLASRTDEQASALEETSASLEEISGTVRSNAENTEKARLLANQATQLSAQGSESVTAAIAQMAAIQDSSRRIVEIITTVNDIAFQTNLLALNAAVEAARAGDQGRGFAVVATEVRNLAQRSSQAAKEIQDLIKDSVGKIEAGTATVNESGKILREISKGINEVTQLVTEVSAAAKEQASAIQEINTALTQMDQVTQQNAELVQNAARNSSGLNSQVQDLRGLVSRFQLTGGDGEESHAPARDPARQEASTGVRNRLAEADAETAVREPARTSTRAAAKPAREPVKVTAEASGNGKDDSLDHWEDIN